jgi:hypothetical protein
MNRSLTKRWRSEMVSRDRGTQTHAKLTELPMSAEHKNRQSSIDYSVNSQQLLNPSFVTCLW